MAEDPKLTNLKEFLAKSLDLLQWEIKDDDRSKPWFEEMRRKCRAYIQNNGTKSTTVDEIVDHLKKEALATFPPQLKAEMIDRVEDTLDLCGISLR